MRNHPMLWTTMVITSAMSVTGCATIVSQNEVGVRDTLGEFSDEPSYSGLKLFFWPIWDITTVSIQTENMEVRANLPSREGLTIASEVSILYRVRPADASKVLADVGQEYEESLILPVFRSAIADVSARYDAKDMHSGKRSEIEEAVRIRMDELLSNRGFEIQAVLLKSIQLPEGLARSIENRLQAEQDAGRMLFVLDQEKREAERRLIEAQGIRDSQRTIAEGLTPEILRFRAIEALSELYGSDNAKVVITDGSGRVLIGDD
ncbi:MAG: prohibitin family protein [Myxococcota bacterium]